jgi:hypothetical protein
MKHFLGAMLAMVLVSGPGGAARGDDNDANAVLDKAIKALGGRSEAPQGRGDRLEGQGQVDS